MKQAPVIIIGAGRSGTNILRDTLSALPNWTTWDCDEINLIWRHGNMTRPDDEFPASAARPEVRNFIRASFDKIGTQPGTEFVLEKTCANSLRVPFVDAVTPEAKYIYIVRDGRDVALSAARRWTASPEMRYLMKKLRYAPVSDIPYYAARFIQNRVHQWRSKERRQAIWGPRFKGMDDFVRSHGLIEICAKQWAECVKSSDAAFDAMPDGKVFRVHYEEFVAAPVETLTRIGDWLGQDIVGRLPETATKRIRPDLAGGWRNNADAISEDALQHMTDVLKAHGY